MTVLVIFGRNVALPLLCVPHSISGAGQLRDGPPFTGGTFQLLWKIDGRGEALGIFDCSCVLTAGPIWICRTALKPDGCLSGALDQPQPSRRLRGM